MSIRFRLLLIGLGALLVVATFTYPRWQPLLEREENTGPVEVFAGLAPELQPTFEALPPNQRNAYRERANQNPQAALAMVSAALQAATVVPPIEQALPDMSGPVVAATGEFTRLDEVRWASGTVTIYRLADNSKILRFEEFSMIPGPEMYVVLSAASEAMAGAGLLTSNDIDLGPLKGTVGNQNYEIPAEVDLSRYATVIILSRSLNIVYSVAVLTPA